MRNPESQAWREEIPAEDTAPPPEDTPPLPKPEDWGVTPEEARELLERQMCPVCGEGPWASPLNHVSRKHAINRHVMRDICLLSSAEKVTDEASREKWSRNGSAKTDVLRANSSRARGTRRTKKPRMTNAFRASLGKGLEAWMAENPDEIARLRAEFRDRMDSPEARAKWDESMARVREEREYTDEEREEFRRRMWDDPEVVARRTESQESRKVETCQIEGCDRAHVARGFCKMHWNRWRETGDPGEATARFVRQSGNCAVEGCERDAKTKGWCKMHYERALNNGGDPGEAAPRKS